MGSEVRLMIVEPGERERAGPALASPYTPSAPEKAWFDARVREVEPILRSVALRQCRDPADTDDLLQATFECALRDLWKFDRTTSFRAWVTQILVNRIFQLARQRRRPLELVSDVASLHDVEAKPQAPEEAWARVSVEDLMRCLPSVRSPFREVFQLHALEHRSYKEIAAELEVPMGTVTSRLKRAREQLRTLLLPQAEKEAP